MYWNFSTKVDQVLNRVTENIVAYVAKNDVKKVQQELFKYVQARKQDMKQLFTLCMAFTNEMKWKEYELECNT